MPQTRFTFVPTNAARSAVAVTAISMFTAFGAASLMSPAHPGYAIVNAAAVDQSSDTVGISDNNLLFSSTDPAVIAKHLDEIQALGVQDIRIPIAWATTEYADGQYNWTAIDNMVNAADARGMGILGVVNTTPDWARGANTGYYSPPTNAADYGNFMGAVAARYAGKMSDFEVWNEPNAFVGYSPSPDPAGYTALLKAAYPAIKAANPSATVIGGVLGSTVTWGNYTLNPVDFVQQMYADGAAGYFDALSFHPYQNTTEFSQGANLANSPLNQVTDIRQLMVDNGDTSKLIWTSEYGLPTGIVGDQQQADYISDFLDKWNTLSYAGPAFLYTLQDTNSADTTDPEATFGVYTDTWTPKLAAQVISDFIAEHGTPSAMKLAAATTVADQSAALPTTASPAVAMDTAAQTVAESVNAAMQAYIQGIADAVATAAATVADQAAAASATPTSAGEVAMPESAAPTTTPATESTSPSTAARATTAPSSTTTATDTTTAPTTSTVPTATGSSTATSAPVTHEAPTAPTATVPSEPTGATSTVAPSEASPSTATASTSATPTTSAPPTTAETSATSGETGTAATSSSAPTADATGATPDPTTPSGTRLPVSWRPPTSGEHREYRCREG